jgi:hypothetical protein
MTAFDVSVRGFCGAMGKSGEGKVTRLEIFYAGVADLNPEVLAWIRAA